MFQPAHRLCLLLITILLLSSSSAMSAGRFALVIGNSAYTGGAPLKNPKNDAELIAKTLTDIGFEVQKVTDAGQKQMRKAMLDFSRKLRNNKDSIGLFYYAGHGLQVRGVNYMVPVTADIKDEEEVAFEGVDVNDFLGTMRSSNSRLNIIILDACRNNPFARSFRSTSRGLAPVQAASGTLIAYSTAPGDVAFDGTGLNSPYTLALARFIRKAGLRVETVFKRVLASVEDATERKQTPWLTGAFRGEFFFVSKKQDDQPATGTQTGSNSSTGNTQNNGQALEKLFWQSILNSTNPASFQAYLTAFPTGLFAPLARLKIVELEKSKKIVVASLPASEAARSPEPVEEKQAAVPGRIIHGAKPKSEETPAEAFSPADSPPSPVPPKSESETNPLTYRAVFPDSSSVSLKRASVEKMSCHKLWLARSEIYARNGYCFKSEKGIRYFDNSNCTTPKIKLTMLESRNVRTIRTWEIRNNCRIKNALNKSIEKINDTVRRVKSPSPTRQN